MESSVTNRFKMMVDTWMKHGACDCNFCAYMEKVTLSINLQWDDLSVNLR